MSRSRTSWRFSLATMFVGVFVVGIACTVVPYPFVAFYTVITLLVLTAAVARIGPSEQRDYWFWFSVCGWVYVLAGMSMLEYFQSTGIWHAIRDWLEQARPGPAWWTPQHYLVLSHAVGALLIAVAGGVIGTRRGQGG